MYRNLREAILLWNIGLGVHVGPSATSLFPQHSSGFGTFSQKNGAVGYEIAGN